MLDLRATNTELPSSSASSEGGGIMGWTRDASSLGAGVRKDSIEEGGVGGMMKGSLLKRQLFVRSEA